MPPKHCRKITKIIAQQRKSGKVVENKNISWSLNTFMPSCPWSKAPSQLDSWLASENQLLHPEPDADWTAMQGFCKICSCDLSWWRKVQNHFSETWNSVVCGVVWSQDHHHSNSKHWVSNVCQEVQQDVTNDNSKEYQDDVDRSWAKLCDESSAPFQAGSSQRSADLCFRGSRSGPGLAVTEQWARSELSRARSELGHARKVLVATLANLEIGFVVLNPGLTDVNSRTVETAVSMGLRGGLRPVERGDSSG